MPTWKTNVLAPIIHKNEWMWADTSENWELALQRVWGLNDVSKIEEIGDR
jgi:hypothetical protein